MVIFTWKQVFVTLVVVLVVAMTGEFSIYRSWWEWNSCWVSWEWFSWWHECTFLLLLQLVLASNSKIDITLTSYWFVGVAPWLAPLAPVVSEPEAATVLLLLPAHLVCNLAILVRNYHQQPLFTRVTSTSDQGLKFSHFTLVSVSSTGPRPPAGSLFRGGGGGGGCNIDNNRQRPRWGNNNFLWTFLLVRSRLTDWLLGLEKVYN